MFTVELLNKVCCWVVPFGRKRNVLVVLGGVLASREIEFAVAVDGLLSP